MNRRLCHQQQANDGISVMHYINYLTLSRLTYIKCNFHIITLQVYIQILHIFDDTNYIKIKVAANK